MPNKFDANMIGKICFTTHSFYPSTDGVSVVNQYLTRGFVQKGYKVVVVTRKIQGREEFEEHDEIKIYRVCDPKDKDGYRKFIKELIEINDILINVCTQTNTTDFLYKDISNIKCLKRILYVHGIWEFGWNRLDVASLHNILSKIYNNAIWRLYYLRNGRYIKQYDEYTQLHNNDDGNIFFEKYLGIKSDIVENAADEAFFEKGNDDDFLKKYKLEPKKYIISIGAYDNNRNQQMVLRAYYESEATDELVFVGRKENEYLENLKVLELNIKKDGGDRIKNKKVRYYTGIPREEIALFVRNAFLFLFGSDEERFPMTIVEPMAAGIPFISTKVGVVEYFPGGYTVEINDVKHMAKYINQVIRDEGVWNRLSHEGADYANKRMRVQAKVDQLEGIILR